MAKWFLQSIDKVVSSTEADVHISDYNLPNFMADIETDNLNGEITRYAMRHLQSRK